MICKQFFFSAWKFGDAPAEQVVKFWFDFEEATVIALETKLLCEHAICGLYPVFLFTSPSSILEHHPYCWLNHNVFCLKLPSLWVKLSFFLVDLTTVFVAAAAGVVVVVCQNTFFLMVDTPSDK